MRRPPRRVGSTGILAGMRRLPDPYDDIAAGRPAAIGLAGPALLGSRLLTKELAFPPDERETFGLRGLLPDRVLTIEEQTELELEHLRVKGDALEQYIGLAALQDRNATLFYRLLTDHLEEFLPIVYTPTVGRACQEFSHIIRRTRGTWITPADRDRIPTLLRQGPFEDVRLIVVTDNERILGLGDQGAGGMAIPTGKLAVYTAACGIHPALTLPVSLDVGTDNPALLADPLYLGYRAPRLRGAEYDALVEAFVSGVEEVWPGCVIQFEDFKQANALRLLDRYQGRVPAFNDDIQGTAAVVLAGVLSGLRATGRTLGDARIVVVGAGGAGIGIGRLLRAAMGEAGLSEAAIGEAIALVDTQGLVHAGRTDLDATKRELAVPAVDGPATPTLLEVVRDRRPTILVGATGVAGTFTEAVIDAMVERVGPADRPIVLPLSNPTSAVRGDAGRRARLEPGPGDRRDRVAVRGGHARRRAPRDRPGQQRLHLPGRRPRGDRRRDPGHHRPHVPAGGQDAGRRRHRRADRVGRALPADLVAPGGVARDRDRRRPRGDRDRRGGRGHPPDGASAAVDAATWWPAYVPYEPVRFVERRRENEA